MQWLSGGVAQWLSGVVAEYGRNDTVPSRYDTYRDT